ncbi:MAG: CAP domain-containing protein [Patescibacteria group bacterium]|nr:CAP domain-containing protein [Patescibacteria group bacterium]MDD4304579.1 CAP domain-containing protein [Patescibacteria group bacterium]MDD4695614.1 CAP domain-containing protein [Patescibacteria group bacterium]
MRTQNLEKYPKILKIIFMLVMKIFLILLIISTQWLSLGQIKIAVAKENISATQIFNLINKERIKRNIPPLTLNNKLIQAAKNKAKDLADKKYFDHNSPNGKQFSSWIKETNYKYSFIGENLAINFQTEETTINAWMKSESHKENILEKNFTETGIAITTNNEGKIIIVQIFGRPESDPITLEETIKNHISEVMIYSTEENYINKNLNIV